MLLVHGLSSNARLWDEVGDHLAQLGFPVLAVDQRGHGESDRPDAGYDFTTMSADLASVILQGANGSVIAAGQSWGGNVVLEMTKHHADLVRGALLVDGGFIRLSDRFPTWESAEAALAPPDFTGITRREMGARSEAMFSLFPPRGVRGQLANFEELAGGTIRARLSRTNHMKILRHLYDHDPFSTASEIDRTVWILAVTGDDPGRESSIESFVDTLTDGRLVWVDGHHDIHAQQPEVVVDLLVDLSAHTGAV